MELPRVERKYFHKIEKMPVFGRVLYKKRINKLTEILYQARYLAEKGVSSEDRRALIKSFYTPLGMAFDKAGIFQRRTQKGVYKDLKGNLVTLAIQRDLSVHNVNIEDIRE